MKRVRITQRDKYRTICLDCFKRLCLLPIGTTIDAEGWYGPGWAVAERQLQALSELAKPMYRIDREKTHVYAMVATKIR